MEILVLWDVYYTTTDVVVFLHNKLQTGDVKFTALIIITVHTIYTVYYQSAYYALSLPPSYNMSIIDLPLL